MRSDDKLASLARSYLPGVPRHAAVAALRKAARSSRSYSDPDLADAARDHLPAPYSRPDEGFLGVRGIVVPRRSGRAVGFS